MSRTLRCLLAAALALAASPAAALELRVLSAGAVEPGMKPALAAFERESGHVVRLTFKAAPELRAALRAAPAAAAVEAKATRVADGASVMRRLLAGTSAREFGFAAMTEIVLFRDQGIRLVGPLPPALQNTTNYVAAPWPAAAVTDAARGEAVAALMRLLQTVEARATFIQAGIEPAL